MLTQVSETSFELVGNHAYLVAEASGHPCRLVVETGAGMTLIDETAAATLGLTLSAPQGAVGAGGLSSVRFGRLSELRLDGVTVRDLPVAVTSLTPLRRRTGQDFHGLLGSDVLQRHVVEIDYAARRMRLHDPERFQYDGAGIAIPFALERNLIVIPVEVAQPGRPPAVGRFAVDTGAGGRMAVALSAPFVAAHHLLDGTNTLTPPGGGTGLGGATVGLIGRLDRIGLANFTLTQPIAFFTTGTGGFLGDASMAGVIGTELLRRFHVTIDYPGRRLILEPSTAVSDRFDYDMSGLTLTTDETDGGHVIVSGVLDSSPASEAGAQAGDVLLAVEGTAVRPTDLAEIRDRWSHPSWSGIVSMQRGSSRIELPLRTLRLI
jgi:hypothetical protein